MQFTPVVLYQELCPDQNDTSKPVQDYLYGIRIIALHL